MPILEILIALYGAKTALSLVARGAWPMELVQHFRPHLIAAGIVGAGLSFLFGLNWAWAVICLGLALVNYAAMPDPPWIKPDALLEKKAGLTVVWANVWRKEKPLERTLAWAKEQNADLILIGEFPFVDPASVLPGDYPHRLDTGPPPKGKKITRVVALSRTPLGDGAITPGPGPEKRPFLTFHIEVAGKSLNVIAAHPVPPNTPVLQKERDRHIAMLAPMAREPFLIAGDFNTTPWCSAYKSIPGRRVGSYLFKPTWLTNLPLLGLPIDHILLSAGLKASLYRVGPFMGSDHRAILVRMHLPTSGGGP